ncbi:MAG: Trk system potassium transporter TrkA [Planctomycetota bacterium]
MSRMRIKEGGQSILPRRHMNILIVGLGEVGSYLAKVLSTEGHAVTVVDPNLDRIRRVADLLDVQVVQGDGSRPDVLDKADAPTADVVLAVSNDDRVNMLTSLFGKRMGSKRVVLRLRDTSSLLRMRTFFKRNLEYDLLLTLDDLAAQEVLKHVREKQVLAVESYSDGRIQLHRVKAVPGSDLIGCSLKSLGIPKGMLVAAIDRAHDVIIPSGDDKILADDEVFLLGEPKIVGAFEKRHGMESTCFRNVVVYGGGGGVPVKVCEALRRNHIKVRLIVEDREEAERLSEVLQGVVVLHADATDMNFLNEEHVGDADAFLGLSERDERNLMSCQLAHTLGVKRTVALVQKPDYVALYQQLGIDVAVSPRLLCANRILAFVRSRSISTIASIEEGKAEVLEVEVSHGSKLAGRTLKEAGLPRGCVIGAITREDGNILYPTGDDEVLAGDHLVVFALAKVLDKVLTLAGVPRE